MFLLRVFVKNNNRNRKSISNISRSKIRYLVCHQSQQQQQQHQLLSSVSSLVASRYNYCCDSTSTTTTTSSSSCYSWNNNDVIDIPGKRHHQNQQHQSFFRRPIRYFSSSNNTEETKTSSEDETTATDAKETTTNSSAEDEVTTSVNNNNDEWIPPNRPLSGDQGYHGITNAEDDDDFDDDDDDIVDANKLVDDALFLISDDDNEEEIMKKLEEALKLEEELEIQQLEKQIEYEKKQNQKQHESLEGDHHINPNIDWMETRRAKLGLSSEDDDDGINSGSIIPIHEHVLLTSDEIISILEYMGGKDLKIIMFDDDDDDDDDKQDLLHTKGVIFCTAPSSHMLQNLSKSLIDHMRIRKLHKTPTNVPGAQINTSKSSSSFHRQQQSLQTDNIKWDAIDCSSYIVHIMNETTRNHLKLEDLWSGNDPLWKVNILDDDAVDDYIAKNPVPISYGSYGYGSILDNATTTSSKQLLRQGFAPVHRPVIPTEIKQSQSRVGKKWKRENRKKKYE